MRGGGQNGASKVPPKKEKKNQTCMKLKFSKL